MHGMLKAHERLLTDQSLIGRDFVLRDLFMGTMTRGPIETIEEEPDGIGTHLLITTSSAARKEPDGTWAPVGPIVHPVQKRLSIVDTPRGGMIFSIDIEGLGIICPPGENLDPKYIQP